MDKAAWSTIVARYQHCSTKRALWQLATTLIPYFLLWYVIYHAVEISLWLTIPPAVLAGAFLMAYLRNRCTVLGWSNYVQEIIVGHIIIIAVAADQWRLRAASR